MAYVHNARPALRPAHSGFLAGLVDGLRRRRLEWQTYSELSDLSDRELDDLGLSRSDLRVVARRAAGRS